MVGRAEETRSRWHAVLSKHLEDRSEPLDGSFWSPLDKWSRDQVLSVQQEKLRSVVPFLYENSPFYRARFERLGLIPDDIADFDDLRKKWPVVTKEEMMVDAEANQPCGTYQTIGQAEWDDRGWLQFSSSGSSGIPRVFRYTHFDRRLWEQTNARALYAGGLRAGDTIMMATGYGPHVFAWGVHVTAQKMGVGILPGGGLDSKARASIIDRFKPTVLLATPSYALYLAGAMEQGGFSAKNSSIRLIITGGEPFSSIDGTLDKIQSTWGATALEFYGCTEASPHCGGYSCPEYQAGDLPAIHLMEDIQAWETVDPINNDPVAGSEKGLTVCTNLNSESSPQLRFLVGDYTTLDRTPCGCGRSHVRAMGCIKGRADDLINLRGIKFFPAQIENAVRKVRGAGNEYQIHLSTLENGLDVMKVQVEHENGGALGHFQSEIAKQCEIRCEVEVLKPGTLPKTEHKARRVFDDRDK